MDFSKLTRNQQLALGGGVLAIISMFSPWYGVFGFNISAFDSGFFAWGGLILTIAAATILVLKGLEKADVKIGNLAAEQVAIIVSAFGLVAILLRWLTQNDITKFGLYLGIVAAGLLVYASFGAMQDAGLELPSADDFKSNNE